MEPVSIYRQERIKGKLEKDLVQDRLAPSMIFYGLPGLGKERMAFYLAQLILCRSREGGACGECISCRKVVKLIHPDVQWLFPKPGSVVDDELEKILDRKSREDFFRPSFGKTVSHAIDAVRNLRAISGKRPYEGAAKVFIIAEGDRMTVEAANAFLKLLEEPPDDTVIVITTSRLYALLPTIRSRCEELRFAPLSLGDLKEVLIEDLGIPSGQADQLSRISEGSLGKAAWLLQQKGKNGWDDAWRIFELACQGGEGDRYAYIVEGPLRRDRERIRVALEALVPLLRDLIVVTLGLGEEEIINISRHDQLKTCEGLRVNGLIRSIKIVEELQRLLDRNVNASILLWRLLRSLSVNITAG